MEVEGAGGGGGAGGSDRSRGRETGQRGGGREEFAGSVGAIGHGVLVSRST